MTLLKNKSADLLLILETELTHEGIISKVDGKYITYLSPNRSVLVMSRYAE